MIRRGTCPDCGSPYRMECDCGIHDTVLILTSRAEAAERQRGILAAALMELRAWLPQIRTDMMGACAKHIERTIYDALREMERDAGTLREVK